MYGPMSAPVRIRGPMRRPAGGTPSYRYQTTPRMGVYTTRRLGAYFKAPRSQLRLAGLGAIDSATGYPVDSASGEPYDPASGQYVVNDPSTGLPAYIDTSGNYVILGPYQSNTAGVSVSTSVTTANPTGYSSSQPTGGNPFSAILNTITGAAAAATSIMNAADLAQVNSQRASQGLPPLNAYGQIGPITRTSVTNASIFASPLFLIAIVGGVILLLRR